MDTMQRAGAMWRVEAVGWVEAKRYRDRAVCSDRAVCDDAKPGSREGVSADHGPRGPWKNLVVDSMNTFLGMCRQNGQQAMHNGTYRRIGRMGRRAPDTCVHSAWPKTA